MARRARAHGITASLAAVVSAGMIAATSLTAVAPAAQAAAISAGSAGSTAGTAAGTSTLPSAPCVVALNAPQCQSTDPQLTADFDNTFDTSACTFTFSIDWGDGSQAEQYTVDGQAQTGDIFAANHTYQATQTQTYTITVTPVSTTGPCGEIGGTFTFTLDFPSQPTTVTTSLSGGSESGASISVPGETAVTDTATLSGPNAATATGTVTYDVYSDAACTVVVSAGTAEAITTPGTLPASDPLTLNTPGTYYWQATYSGDANNAPSTSTCGTAGEAETVTSCGIAAVGYQAAPTATRLKNWGGYDAESRTACTFTSVNGQWVQPAVVCPRHDEGTLETDFWVGLDGPDPSSTVEQTGIQANCIWGLFGYHTEYSAWYEMYPDLPVYSGGNFNNLDPKPGSLVKAAVIYEGKGKYSLNLSVTTDGDTQDASTEQLCTNVCQNISAEWIVEKVRPYGMADFRIWELTGGEATTAANPGEQTVASFNPVRNIVNIDPHLRAVPFPSQGSSFVVVAVDR
jgi:hypothetical protein